MDTQKLKEKMDIKEIKEKSKMGSLALKFRALAGQKEMKGFYLFNF